MYRELKELSEACRERVASLAELLVRTPSYSFKEEAAAGAVQDILEDLGYDLVFRDEAGNVIGFLTGSEEGPTVLLSSHMDTRRVEDDGHFLNGSLSAGIGGDRLTGPGAAGCKSSAASQIFAGHILDRSTLTFNGTIVFAATVAQEGGNGAGMRHLMDVTLPKLGASPDMAILGGPTALQVCNGHDGWADIDVAIRASEGAAVRRSAAAIHAALARAAKDAPHGDWESSLHVSEPACRDDGDQCEAELRARCRVSQGQAVTDCVGFVKRLALGAVEPSGRPSIDVRVHGERRRFYTGKAAEVLCWSNPWSSDPAQPLVQRALEALAAAGFGDARARAFKIKSLQLSTAGNLLADSYHVPTICFGPGDESRTYALDESVEIDKLVGAVFGTAVLIHGAVGNPVSRVWQPDRAPKNGEKTPTKRSGG